MKRRLFWLFLLTCGLLLILSLLVVGEAPSTPPPAREVTLQGPVALQPQPPEPPAAPEDEGTDVHIGKLAPPFVEPVQITGGTHLPYHAYAYYAFHYSDCAG